MRTKLLRLLLAVALLLVSATPAFAQDDPEPITPPGVADEEVIVSESEETPSGATADQVFGQNAVFLPFLSNVRELGIEAEAAGAASAAARTPAALDSNLILAAPVEGDGGPARLDSALRGATGRVEVVVQLIGAPAAQVAAVQGASAAAAQSEAAVQAAAAQDSLVQWVMSRDPSAIVSGRMRVALNAVIMEVDAALLSALAARPGVQSVNAVVDYELDLSETVPHIGAAAAQAAGVTGDGVTVAVLDSGIDYTHKNLGGPGTLAAYDAAYGTEAGGWLYETNDGLFPTAKVIAGRDFVGEAWGADDAPRTEDEDPIDFGGHGTHVADIIAGNDGGSHKGVAPDAKLMAIKVCSAVSTACNGVALLLGTEFALDPNGDGAITDAADVINLSLGSSYGQKEDDLSLALANAVHAGVVVVASAGNAADRPYIVGSPSSQAELISVAQTTVPSDRIFQIAVNEAVLPGIGLIWQPWSGAPVAVAGTLQYGDGAGGNLNGCAAFPAGTLAGRIVVVDRGSCTISLKVWNAELGGAAAAIVANNASQGPGDPPPIFSSGGEMPTIPGYTSTQADGMTIKGYVGQPSSIDPATAVVIENTMVSSSSRGPNYSFNAIKPDIGAPGASLSAEVGTGDGQTPFSGTSGAAPMVAGAAALMVDAFPHMPPAEIKARLMNTGETDIYINPVALPGYLAPITRIGGGEVRVFDALSATTSAWDNQDKTGSLSFGYHAITGNRVFYKWLRIRNYSNTWRNYRITPEFRYADDAASGAVNVNVQRSVRVPPRGSALVLVQLKVNAKKLPSWGLDGGFLGGDGWRLQSVEFDGYLRIQDHRDDVHVPWQILPRKAAHVVAWKTLHHRSAFTLLNAGVETGEANVFALLGESPRAPKESVPGPGDNAALIDLRAVGARPIVWDVDDAGNPIYGLQIAITTYGQRSHPAYPAEFDVYLDIDEDGASDYVLYTAELSGFAATGRVVVYAVNLATGAGAAYAYIDADLNSANAILSVPLEGIGNPSPTAKLGIDVYAFDNYFTGYLTDAIEGIQYTPFAPRYFTENDVISVAKYGIETVRVYSDPAGATASPSQTGLLLLYRNQAANFEADLIRAR